jgi:protein-tyrosine phosphatase
MEPFSQVALERRGIDPGGFVARQLTDVCVEEADLVLTATRLHRAAVVGLVPAAVRRTFTLREFAALAGPTKAASPPSSPDVVADAMARVAVAGRLRGAASIAAVEAEELDIADPIGARLGFYLARAAEIDTACVLAVGLLLGRPGLDGPTD